VVLRSGQLRTSYVARASATSGMCSSAHAFSWERITVRTLVVESDSEMLARLLIP
jgi:hypothetical protein